MTIWIEQLCFSDISVSKQTRTVVRICNILRVLSDIDWGWKIMRIINMRVRISSTFSNYQIIYIIILRVILGILRPGSIIKYAQYQMQQNCCIAKVLMNKYWLNIVSICCIWRWRRKKINSLIYHHYRLHLHNKWERNISCISKGLGLDWLKRS